MVKRQKVMTNEAHSFYGEATKDETTWVSIIMANEARVRL